MALPAPAARSIDRCRVGFLGVKPEFQHTGVAAQLYIEHFDQAAIGPVTWGEMGWILETNRAMNRGMEAMGGQVVKRYRHVRAPLRARRRARVPGRAWRSGSREREAAG